MNDTNGNGHANGNGKIFDLAPKQDPLLSQIVPAARRKVCLMTKISEAARMFFCYITDMSLLPGVNSRKGVVKFSDQDLACRFKVNVKTIRNWKRAIESTGEIWFSQKNMKNTFPQTVYNVAGIVGEAMLPMNVESEDGSLPDDENWSSNRRRQRLVFHDPATGKFASRGTPPGLRTSTAAETTPSKSEENPPSENFLPPTTAMDCRPPRQMVAAHAGKNLPSATAIDCRPARKPIAALAGKILPLATAINCRSGRQTVADNRETKDVSQSHPEGSFKRSTGLNAQNRAGGAKKLDAENAFIADVAEVMELWKPGHSKVELTGSGAWWRLSYRIRPALAGKVLAEISVMVKEGTIKFNPGSTAIDLWTRWGGGKVCNERAEAVIKQKAAVAVAAGT